MTDWRNRYEESEREWSSYAATLHQRLERLLALARRRGIDEEAIAGALRDAGR